MRGNGTNSSFGASTDNRDEHSTHIHICGKVIKKETEKPKASFVYRVKNLQARPENQRRNCRSRLGYLDINRRDFKKAHIFFPSLIHYKF